MNIKWNAAGYTSNFSFVHQYGEDVLRQHRIPMDKCFGYKDINGASMVWMNENNFKLNKESIHKFIYGEVYAR